ncbi:MICOS complex subunit Mic60 isoform X2 [Trichogramma pretiosum]|uniref:MICOS complex subunit Mic60 isoform X2 n=1 Tax=Trichogramma pretiosum TaxID=7493 RepID=UPI0006C9991C|nr:MICOS complex subunit Mic60 isoform X2 [Trichogramma pretiosum]
MFRIGLKLPVNGLNLNRIQKQGCQRLYITSRSFETKSRTHDENRLFKNDTLSTRLSAHKYSSDSRSGKSGGSTGTLVTLGAITLGAVGILTYAKNDKEFRATLENWLPGTDRTIQIIFQEEESYLDHLLNFFTSLKNKILDMLFGKDPNIPDKVATTVDRKNLEEFKLVEKSVSVPVAQPIESKTADLHELERFAGELAKDAISGFQQAAVAVQDYNKDVLSVVENSDSKVGNQIWDKLKVASEKRKKALSEAEKKADEAVTTLKRLEKAVDDPKLEATQGQKTITKKNIRDILANVDKAKDKFDQEAANSNITERYWKNVKAAREQFNDELQILFPNMNINDKKFAVTEEAFDLFVLHMYHKVAFLQKELEKLQTVADAKIQTALKTEGDQDKIQQAIDNKVSKEKRNLQKEFDKKLLAERKVLDDELRRQLMLQAQVHADHMREALGAKDREMDRKIERALSEQKEQDSSKSKNQLAAVIGRLRGLDEAIKSRMEAEKDANEAQLMWGACQSLARAVKAAPPGTKPQESLRPLDAEIRSIVKAAPEKDAFVQATIKGIPEEAVKRGVYPEDALRERFIKVEQMARKLALVPEEGASLPIYLLSYLQSFLLVKAVSPIPKHELDDQPIDAESLNTYEVLQRARYWLDRGDFKMTLRYMNLLKGAPRSVARDWMNEARILLETQQAIESLVAYAGANSLVFMGGGENSDKKK